jgi:hypothetical protein
MTLDEQAEREHERIRRKRSGQVSSKNAVPDVPGVQARRGAGSSRNGTKKPDVPDVPLADPASEAEDGERAAEDPSEAKDR